MGSSGRSIRRLPTMGLTAVSVACQIRSSRDRGRPPEVLAPPPFRSLCCCGAFCCCCCWSFCSGAVEWVRAVGGKGASALGLAPMAGVADGRGAESGRPGAEPGT